MSDDVFPKIKDHAERYAAHRQDAHAVHQTKLVANAKEVQLLDEHIKEFQRHLKKDSKNHEVDDLRKHARAFEHEIHEELELLFKKTRKDIEMYTKTLHALVEFRNDLRILIEDPRLGAIADSELRYAKLLLESADEKVETLGLLFKKMKQR